MGKQTTKNKLHGRGSAGHGRCHHSRKVTNLAKDKGVAHIHPAGSAALIRQGLEKVGGLPGEKVRHGRKRSGRDHFHLCLWHYLLLVFCVAMSPDSFKSKASKNATAANFSVFSAGPRNLGNFGCEMPRMPSALRLHGPQVEFVGKLIKQAKRRVLWKFAFDGDGDDHSVTLHHTLNSGKKVVHLNGTEIWSEEKVCCCCCYLSLSSTFVPVVWGVVLFNTLLPTLKTPPQNPHTFFC